MPECASVCVPHRPTCLHVLCTAPHHHNHHHSVHRPESLKTFQAFSSLFSSSRQFEEGFLNDPLIIGSGVTLVFQLCLLAFLPPPPLYLFLRGFFCLCPHRLPPLTPEWLFGPFVCAHEVEFCKVPESISFCFLI